jgi:hypothetical protein
MHKSYTRDSVYHYLLLSAQLENLILVSGYL